MAWTNITFSFGSVLTSTKMTQLDDNFEALANGDSGSPKIQEAAITGQAAVDRSALKTATGTRAGNIIANGTVDITLNAYSFFPMIHQVGVDVRVCGHSADGASADAPRFRFINSSGKSSSSYDVDERYVAA